MAALDGNEYDLIIIGAGMCGSAAARHALLINQHLKVLLIGPKEFEMTEPVKDSPAKFSCHADEGRITRQLDKNDVWACLATRSIERYKALEVESGITFHYPVGFMVVDSGSDVAVEQVKQIAIKRNIQTKEMTNIAIKEQFPYLDLKSLINSSNSCDDDEEDDDSIHALVELSEEMKGESGAGYINARKFVMAQQKVFIQNGGIYLNDAVDKVIYPEKGNNIANEWQLIQTCGGLHFKTKRILVVTNNATNFRPLLPQKLDLVLTSQMTARFVLKDEDAQIMKHMPSMVVKLHTSRATSSPYSSSTSSSSPSSSSSSSSQIEEQQFKTSPWSSLPPEMESCYILPPVLYPNEGYAIKMGHGKIFENILKDEKSFLNWHEKNQCRNDDDDEGDIVEGKAALVNALHRLLPNIEPQDIVYNRCATANTQHGYPYIDIIDSSTNFIENEKGGISQEEEVLPNTVIGCCVGCNGYAAKSSDEIGRLAARMILSKELSTSSSSLSSVDSHEVFLNLGEDETWADGLDPTLFRAVIIPSP